MKWPLPAMSPRPSCSCTRAGSRKRVRRIRCSAARPPNAVASSWPSISEAGPPWNPPRAPAPGAETIPVLPEPGLIGDLFGWLLTALGALGYLVTLAVKGVFWLLGLIWWPIGQGLSFVVDGLGLGAGRLQEPGSYDLIAADYPGTAREIDLLSFAKGGWGDDTLGRLAGDLATGGDFPGLRPDHRFSRRWRETGAVTAAQPHRQSLHGADPRPARTPDPDADLLRHPVRPAGPDRI